MRRRAAGGPGPGAVSAPLPPEPRVPRDGEGRQAQERVAVRPAPAAALEAVQPRLVLRLAARSLAPPPAPGQGGRGLERGVGRRGGRVALAPARGAAPADRRGLVPGRAPA